MAGRGLEFPKITITGDLGSGKSSVSKLLKASLGFEIYATGQMQREIAAKYGMTTLELNKYSETHPEIDREIDDFSRGLGQRQASLIVDSRLAWHFIPHSFKVFLAVSADVAASRIMADSGRQSESYPDLESCKQAILQRKSLENERFLHLYQVDCAQMDHYDLVVDTSFLAPAAVAEAIIGTFTTWTKGPKS